MPNTTYDNGQKGNMMPQGVNNQYESQSVAGSEKHRSSKYKKYGLKDYNNMKDTIQSQKMGGLGANIGGDKWEAAKRKKALEMQYANNLKMINYA